MNYRVTIPLYSIVLVKDVENSDEAIEWAIHKVKTSIKHASIDCGEDIDVCQTSQEGDFHLVSKI